MFVARVMPSSVLWPVPYRLSKRCFVFASFTAMIGYFSAPSFAIAFKRITPVVVSSVPPTIPSSRSVRFWWISTTRSAPSSMVSCGRWSNALFRCL